MQFKVPQDVQQADRIVAFLTLPQLIICVCGGGVAYAVFVALTRQGLNIVFWLPPVAIIALMTLAFAFLKIANLPFHKYLALLIERLITPSKRVWIKGADRILSPDDMQTPEEKKIETAKKKEEEQLASKAEQIQNIEKLTDILDQEKQTKEADPLKEIDQTPDEKLVQKAFLKEGKPNKQPEKKEETAEEKILKLSKDPNQPSEEQPKKKRRRRRRKRKKKSGEEVSQNTPAPKPQPKPEPVPEPVPAPVQMPQSEPQPEPAPTPEPQPVPQQETPTTAKKSDEFKAEELREGQTITFPKS